MIWPVLLLAACHDGGPERRPSRTADSDTPPVTDTDPGVGDSDSPTVTDTDPDSASPPTDTATDTGTPGVPWVLPGCSPLLPDPLNIEPSEIQVALPRLIVPYTYSGGCEQHGFGWCYGQAFEPGQPDAIELYLIHDANGDMCQALGLGAFEIPMGPVAAQYEAEFGAPPSALEVRVNWVDAQLQPQQHAVILPP